MQVDLKLLAHGVLRNAARDSEPGIVGVGAEHVEVNLCHLERLAVYQVQQKVSQQWNGAPGRAFGGGLCNVLVPGGTSVCNGSALGSASGGLDAGLTRRKASTSKSGSGRDLLDSAGPGKSPYGILSCLSVSGSVQNPSGSAGGALLLPDLASALDLVLAFSGFGV